MESKFESRVGQSNLRVSHIYNFLADFNNLKQFVPADKVKDFESDTDSCRFSVPNLGKVGLRIVEREIDKTIKVSGDGMGNQQFNLWLQLKEVSESDTRIKFTLKADLNPMLKMMASKPIQNFLDKLVEIVENIRVA